MITIDGSQTNAGKIDKKVLRQQFAGLQAARLKAISCGK
jgi:hypothetical protein